MLMEIVAHQTTANREGKEFQQNWRKARVAIKTGEVTAE
jgi:hypothetical protein